MALICVCDAVAVRTVRSLGGTMGGRNLAGKDRSEPACQALWNLLSNHSFVATIKPNGRQPAHLTHQAAMAGCSMKHYTRN